MFRVLAYIWTTVATLVVVVLIVGWWRHEGAPENAVGVVEVEGVIDDSDEIVEVLDDLAEKKDVHAVVLRVNSPGGAVAPAQEIYDAVLRVREKKPIVASLAGMAASGGYYVASACDAIVSNPGTLTGSIGVIMQLGNLEDLLEKVGLDGFVLKAGRYKDTGSPLRPMKEDERELLEELLENVHEQFIEAISRGRGMPIGKVRGLADGRIFSGLQAYEAGLIDELGGLHEAVALAAERAGLEGKPEMMPFEIEQPPWWWKSVFGALSRTGGELFGLRFLYPGPGVTG